MAEQMGACQMGQGSWKWVKRVKGLRSADWELQNSRGDGKYRPGHVLNNIVITIYIVQLGPALIGGITL